MSARRTILDTLSAEAVRIMVAEIEKKTGNREIAAKIKRATGETVSHNTIGHHKTWRHQEKEEIEAGIKQFNAYIEEKRKNGYESNEAVEAVIGKAFKENHALLAALMQKDPARAAELLLEAQRVGQGDRRLTNDEKKTSIADRRVIVLEKKVGTAQKQARKLQDAAAGDKSLKPEIRKKIRELVYGLDEETN